MDFFRELSNHSEVKLSILKKYTIPWMRKIILNKYGPRKCLIIDGFAGPGKYDDDSDGSPMILIKNAIDFYNQSKKYRWKDPQIYILLNELDSENHKKLIENVKVLGFETSNNKTFHSKKYTSIKIVIENKTFELFLNNILSITRKGSSLIPSFCFVDPFGFSSTPFELFKEYLKNENSELLINFIYEFTNRFITHPNEKIKEQISKHMGLVKIEDLSEKVKGLPSDERKDIIIETYTKNLLQETDATYVRNFDIKVNGKTKMILFHVTKNINGLILMKNTMWKFDETGQYVYDVKTDEFRQLVFEEILASDQQYHREILSQQISNYFANKKNVTIKEIINFVAVKTDYPIANFMKPALKILEKNNTIYNIRGRNHSMSYPDNTIMDFK